MCRPPAQFFGAYSSWYSGSVLADPGYLNRFPHRVDPDQLTPEDLRFVRDRYLENAAFADDLVGRLIRMLESAGRYDQTLIILLSDHGEAFMEHGRFLHGRFVHREFLHVPLVVKWPVTVVGRQAVIEQPVSLVDLAPTLVDGLGLEAAAGFQGRSWLPAVFDGEVEPRTLWAVTRGAPRRRRPPQPSMMLEHGSWRILYRPLDDTSRIYRTDRDAGEQQDLAHVHPLQTRLLRQQVLIQAAWNRRLLGGDPEHEEPSELDPEVVEQLEALGYVN